MNVFLDTVPGHNLIVRVVDCCQADECRVHVMLPGCLWKCLILHWRDSHIHSCLFFSWAISGSFLSGSEKQHTGSQSLGLFFLAASFFTCSSHLSPCSLPLSLSFSLPFWLYPSLCSLSMSRFLLSLIFPSLSLSSSFLMSCSSLRLSASFYPPSISG